MLSVYTNSVASAYFLPLRGVEGAGEGGRLWPSKSNLAKAFPKDLTGKEDAADEVSPVASKAAMMLPAPTKGVMQTKDF